MIRSFLSIILPEDEYKRLRVLYFMSEAAFLMGGLLLVGSALNNYWLKWNLEEVEVTFILMMIPMLMAGYTYFRYIFSGIEHTEVSTKQGYKKSAERPLSDVQTGAPRNEIKDTRRGTSRC
jgi:hypothetical protein